MGPVTRTGSLVGRAEELSTLRTLGLSRAAGPAAAMIVGVPGMGKSRLLAELDDLVPGRRVLRMVGFELERQVPLGAAVPFLKDVGKQGLHGVRLQELLAEDDPARGSLEPVRVFEATYRSLCEFRHATIIIDDLQWLDELSRALVHYVMRAAVADRSNVLLACATRPSTESAVFAASLRELLGDSDHYAEMTLGPLSWTEGAHLVEDLRPGKSSAWARKIWTGAGGSPFWIELAVRVGADPDAQAAVLPRLLGTLSADGVRCLGAVVIGDKPLDAPLLEAVLAWPEGRVSTALSELVNRGVVTYDGLFRTAHDLVGQVVLRQLPGEQARRLHRQFADVLRHRSGGGLQMLMEALEHECAAGAATRSLALNIARSSQRRVVGQSGLNRLVEVAEQPSADDGADLALESELAGLAEELGDHELALRQLKKLGESLPTRAQRTAAALRAARQALELGRTVETAALLARVRRDGWDDEWAMVGADALDFFRFAWLEHDVVAAEPYQVAALGAARELLAQAGSLDSLPRAARLAYAEALDALRVSALMADELDELLVVADDLVEATRGLGERHLDARLFLCVALRLLNRWPEAEAGAAGVLHDARRQVYPAMQACAGYELALVVYHLGRVAEAQRLYQEARRLGERVNTSFDDYDTWSCGLGELIDASAVSWTTAVATIRQQATHQDDPHSRLMLDQRAALLSARFAPTDSHDVVVALLDSAQAGAGAADCVRCTAELQLVAAEALARVGEAVAARDLLSRWDARWPEPKPRAEFARLRAEAALASVENSEEAPALLRQVIASAHAASTRLEELWGRIDLGGSLAARDKGAAAQAWSAAARLAVELGAVSEAALVGQRLRGMGVRRLGQTRRSAPAIKSVPALSCRELDVACLAITGARNIDIAHTLFISPKTVEQHLSRVFAKLGVRNRAELGSRYGEQLHASSDIAQE